MSSLRTHPREWLQSDGCSVAGLSFPFCLLRAQVAHAGELQLLMTVTSFAYLYGRQYSIYQWPLLVGSLTDICETFHDLFPFFFPPDSAGRLFSGQGNIFVEFLDSYASSRLYLVDNKRFSRHFVLLVYYEQGNIFPCYFFPYLELP